METEEILPRILRRNRGPRRIIYRFRGTEEKARDEKSRDSRSIERQFEQALSESLPTPRRCHENREITDLFRPANAELSFRFEMTRWEREGEEQGMGQRHDVGAE